MRTSKGTRTSIMAGRYGMTVTLLWTLGTFRVAGNIVAGIRLSLAVPVNLTSVLAPTPTTDPRSAVSPHVPVAVPGISRYWY